MLNRCVTDNICDADLSVNKVATAMLLSSAACMWRMDAFSEAMQEQQTGCTELVSIRP